MINILHYDEDGKTDDLPDILLHVDQEFSRINRHHNTTIKAQLAASLPADGVDDEELLLKNNSSTILRFSLTVGGMLDKCRFLTRGDTEVTIWENLWVCHAWQPDRLSHDILFCRFHCSWHCQPVARHLE